MSTTILFYLNDVSIEKLKPLLINKFKNNLFSVKRLKIYIYIYTNI